MRTLLIAAAVFTLLFGGMLIFFGASDSQHEYDLKFVLPIDTRQMPKPVAPPSVQSQAEDEAKTVTDGRALAGDFPRFPERAPVQFAGQPNAASEAPAPQ
jgi:hypothetical protein